MAKLKNPLLSFGSHGTIGEAITFQSNKGLDVVRKKPEPRDPQTWPQIYHRWDYQDYLAWWATLSIAEKQVYKSAGAREHNTGVGNFLKPRLTTLPDLIVRYHMDEQSGTDVYDSSKNGITATRVGCTPTPGFYRNGLYFITDDYVLGTNNPLLDFTTGDFTIMAWIFPTSITGVHEVFIRGAANNQGYMFRTRDTRLEFITAQIAAQQISRSGVGAIALNAWQHIAVTREGTIALFYVNGIDATGLVNPHLDPRTSAKTFKIGIYDDLLGNAFSGKIDELTVRNRVLTPVEVLHHAERRAPIQ